ncbi:MAG: hypothetical protein FJX92_01815 [Bacteroidetes bacterium]|nr:hypothetical protein [Bacteroidota bacterium]
MEYNKLVAVSGLPGLFELLTTKSDGAIVRGLDDGQTRFAANRSHQFSHLESIEVFTQAENANLIEVFQAMGKAGKPLPNEKDADAIKNYFGSVYPAFDFDRVYSSDLKKMVKWFAVLQKHQVELKLSEPEAPETNE